MQNEVPFDSNCISPGTEFMEAVNDILKYYIAQRLSTDPAWKKLHVIYSSHRHPGEGEHKIIDFLRDMIKSGKYNDNDRNILLGSDADFILLAQTLHKKNIDIVRKADLWNNSMKKLDIKSLNNDVTAATAGDL